MRKHLIWVLGLALAVGVSAVAYGAGNTLNTQKMKVTVKPSKQPKNKFGNAKLRSLTTTGTTGGEVSYALTPVSKAQILYDKDIKFDTKGLKQCSKNLDGTTTAQALALCKPSQVGKGAARVQLAGNPAASNTQDAVITAFNGKPQGGKPVILLHTRVDAIAATTVLKGVLNKISGKFGWRLDVTVPPLPLATATTIFDVTVNHKPVTTGHGKRTVRHLYVSAKCSRNKWDYRGKFNYKSGAGDPNNRAGSLTVNTSQACTKR